MSSPSATPAEPDDVMAKAKSAGITPIAQFDDGATGSGDPGPDG